MAEMAKTNAYLKNCLWMDFEISDMSSGAVEIAGRIDSSVFRWAISMQFEQSTFVQAPLVFHLDDTRDFIEFANEEEFTELNKKYQIIKGQYLFKIHMEDFEGAAYIAAADIKTVIHDEAPF